MKKFFTLTLLLLLTAVTAVQAQVNFSVKYKRVNPTTIDIIFTGTAQPGWHIYSTNIGEGGPTRAEFGVDKIKGAKLKGSHIRDACNLLRGARHLYTTRGAARQGL